MKKKPVISTIFTDIGGVLLTKGWDRGSRRKAIDLFKLDHEETEERHHLTFDTYEVGKITLDEYLDRVVFYKKQSFTRNRFRQFMYDQSRPLPHMIGLVRQLKKKYSMKLAVVSFVHFRKPDADIFRIALDTAQVSPEQVVYIEDRAMFVQVAQGLHINGLQHIDYNSTCEKLKAFGIKSS